MRRRLWISAIIIGLLLPVTGRAQPVLRVDEKVGHAEGWTIGYNSTTQGCIASQTYSDETTMWLGIDSNDRGFYLALTNPKWESIAAGKEYLLRFATVDGTRWQGKFVGVTRDTEKGIISGGLKEAFIRDLVRTAGIAVSLGNRSIARLSLHGSPAAINAISECRSERTGTRRSTAPGNPRGSVSTGTGFYISTSGHVLTNNHVVDGCSLVDLDQPGLPPYSGRIIATDRQNDLAVILAANKPTAVAPIRSDVRLGENIAVFGFPLTSILATSGNFTVGYVSALAGMDDNSGQIQISAPIQPGNSGGPVFDKFGNVVAVIVSTGSTAALANATGGALPQNLNFAIKSTIASGFLAAHEIKPDSSVIEGKPLDTAELAERAKATTVRIKCKH
jgi:S1-C subfamily serine protease